MNDIQYIPERTPLPRAQAQADEAEVGHHRTIWVQRAQGEEAGTMPHGYGLLPPQPVSLRGLGVRSR